MEAHDGGDGTQPEWRVRIIILPGACAKNRDQSVSCFTPCDRDGHARERAHYILNLCMPT